MDNHTQNTVLYMRCYALQFSLIFGGDDDMGYETALDMLLFAAINVFLGTAW